MIELYFEEEELGFLNLYPYFPKPNPPRFNLVQKLDVRYNLMKKKIEGLK